MTAFTYTGENLREVAFPLGGIGTGCVSLEGRGALRDWEIFNRPNKNTILPDTFATLWCRTPAGETDCRVVQGPPNRDFTGNPGQPRMQGFGFGVHRGQGNGLPHFADAAFTGTFPRGRVDLHQPAHPLRVSLDAFSPFVPLDADASAMPVACLCYQLRNESTEPIELALAFNLFNAIGYRIATDDFPDDVDQALNQPFQGAHCRGIGMTHEALAEDDPRYGTMALTTDWPDTTVLPHWPRAPKATWFDAIHHFWDQFSTTGELPSDDGENSPGHHCAGSIAMRAQLASGESATVPVLISWCFPNFQRYWHTHPEELDEPQPQWTNHYAHQHPTAWDAAEHFFANRSTLTNRTHQFERALHDSTLPDAVIESVGATATTFRTPTCLRYEDGTFWGWEGCSPQRGCCPGSCTHVWNYVQSLAHLFPDLHRTMRRSEYEYGAPKRSDDDTEANQGELSFRIPLPLEQKSQIFKQRAALDGQLGGIIQLYRDWRFSGDDAYLRRMWPHARQALEYAWVEWDADRDGMIEGVHHNTYDIEFDGPNPLAQFMYLGALRAGAAIARYLQEDAAAEQYEQLFDSGRSQTESRLFNGEYFQQLNPCVEDDAPKYQHGAGCLSDQLLGQLGARVAGLGQLVDKEQVQSALRAVYAHNFRDPLGDHANPQRIYAVGDEPGLLLCSWPHGGRPRLPFVYSDEVWTGIEYQVASHLAYEGMIEPAVRVTDAVRRRHDGARRNPYNEFECGSHYARALASWGLLLALSGFRYDAVTQQLTVTPPDDTQTVTRSLFTTGGAWGQFECRPGALELHVCEGTLTLRGVHTTHGDWSPDKGPITLSSGQSCRLDLT